VTRSSTPKNVTNTLAVLLVSFGVYALILLAILNPDNQEIIGILITAGVFIVIILAIYTFIPSRFKTHFLGLVLMILFMILLIVSTNITIQIFLVLFFAADLVYFVFYLGIYAVCIDQVRDEGITNEEYIHDINVIIKTPNREVDQGFLLKDSSQQP